jgi:hypothetical protein
MRRKKTIAKGLIGSQNIIVQIFKQLISIFLLIIAVKISMFKIHLYFCMVTPKQITHTEYE